MEKHPRTVFTKRGLNISDLAFPSGEIDLFAGAMHYWRVPRDDWRACLDGILELGLHVVQTYVPWGAHEVRKGSYDWSDELDLDAFLSEVKAAGLRAILRPGPHINAELTYFGFPRRIVANPSIQAVSGRGTPVWLPVPPRMFPVPSYASTAFRAEVRQWFAAFAEVVKPHLAPDGPIVAVQADNEFQMFFRTGAYDHDYHPDALAWWNEAYPEFADADPPRAWREDDAERCVCWVRFKEVYAARSLEWVSAELRAAGIDVALFHNAPPSEPTNVDIPAAQDAVGGPCGMDFYHSASDYAAYRRRALYLVGSAAPVAFSPEVGLGGPLWLLPMTEDDQKQVILALLAAGVRGMSFYMTVDRDRWYGAPVSVAGELRGMAPWLTKLLGVLEQLEWTRLDKINTPAAIVMSRADARWGVASSFADPLGPVVTEFLGLGDEGSAAFSRDEAAPLWRRWLAAVERAFQLQHIPYEIVDESCSVDVLRRYKMLVLPTLGRVDRALWEKLRSVDTPIILGPERPTHDERGRPLDDAALPPKTGLMNAESLDDPSGLADDLWALMGELSIPFAVLSNDLNLDAFVGSDGGVRAAFLGNPNDTAVKAEVSLGDIDWRDALTDEVFSGEVSIPLQPFQTRLFVPARVN